MYVFANCVMSIPYGSYVLIDQRDMYGATESCIRVHPNHLIQLKSNFKQAGKPDANTSIAHREKYGKKNSQGNRERAPLWTSVKALS